MAENYVSPRRLKPVVDKIAAKIDVDCVQSVEFAGFYYDDIIGDENYCVGYWDSHTLSPDAVEIYGSKDFLKKWNFYLLDTTDNTGETTTPVGKLMRNNLLRFEDGSFAPTVGITESMRAECDAALYLDAAHTQLYSTAGAFNAETFYNEYGMAQKLYDISGNEVRILRPWETTETKYTIGIGRDETIYLIDGVTGNSGKTWKGIFKQPVVWDGIDVSKYPLPPTAIAPCPSCTVGGKMRNFFYLYQGETNCQGSVGEEGLVTMFSENRTYPRTQDVSQITNMNYARAKGTTIIGPNTFGLECFYHDTGGSVWDKIFT